MLRFSVHFLFPFPHSCADSFYTRYTFLFPSGLRSSRSTRSQRHLLVGQWHLPEKLLHELRLQPVFYTLPILLITRRVPRCSPLFFLLPSFSVCPTLDLWFGLLDLMLVMLPLRHLDFDLSRLISSSFGLFCMPLLLPKFKVFDLSFLAQFLFSRYLFFKQWGYALFNKVFYKP